ncbi:hypothetical protein EJB05_23965, partial [Eragrostis curvula]
MALRKITSLSALALLVLVVVMGEPVVAFQLEADNTTSHFPPLLDCGPASAAPSTAFRANVRSLLNALPSAAAAAPTGFATARSPGSGRDRVFARGLCFGASGRGESDGDCLTCLTAAASDVATTCHGSRRGGTWRAGCFLSFADTNATSAREDAFRGWFYDDGDDDGSSPTAALVSQCADDRTASECSRCLNESALVVPELKQRRQLSQIHGESVVVVGYSCVLRVVFVPPPPQWKIYLYGAIFIAEMIIIAVAGVCAIRACIRGAGQMNQNPA